MDKHNHTKLSDDIINKTFVAVFERPSPLDIDGALEKIAFDIKLPVAVHDSTTGEQTWAESINPTRFITQENSDRREEWMMPKQMISSIDDIIEAWRKINFTTTERNFNSTNTFESDTIYDSTNVIRSANCNSCKNILFCDGCAHCEYNIASQRSANSSFCIRADDSSNCTNSYNVICSNKISYSFFIQDCANLHECMFCSHIADKRYCIANMQFEKEEYFELKSALIEWMIGQFED